MTNQQTLMKSQGLSSAKAQERLLKHGPNALPEKLPPTVWQRLRRQFQSPIIYILLAALVIDLLIWLIEGARGLPIEAVAIALILLLNAALGVYQESKAEAALARLQALAAALVWVLRDGKLVHWPSTEIVPGDLVRLEAGDRIPADGVLCEGRGLLIDESILTGESAPVDKEVGDESL